jgi:hypothetical protein
MDKDAARKAFEDKYYKSSSIFWNGEKYEAHYDLAKKEAIILNNWFDVWCSAIEWALVSNN